MIHCNTFEAMKLAPIQGTFIASIACIEEKSTAMCVVIQALIVDDMDGRYERRAF